MGRLWVDTPRIRLGSLGSLFRRGPTIDAGEITEGGDFVDLPVPADYAAQAAAGTPYLLGVNAGVPDWIATQLSLARSTVTVSVPATAAGAWATGGTAAMKAGQLLCIAADQSCAVRLYNRASVRAADLSRDRFTLPDPGSGVLAESWLSLSNSRKQYQSQVPMIYNADEPAASTFYWAVLNNMDVTVPITVTLTLLQIG